MMNVVFVLSDSLNRHFLSPYGNTWVKTPNIARLASRAVTFEQHYTGSAPCMPARRDLWTGCIEFPWRCWGPREPFDEHLALLCRGRGIPTQMCTDHYHYWEVGGLGYHTEFDGCEMIRGHEHDYWSCELDFQYPEGSVMLADRPGHAEKYLQNSARFKSESDFSSPKTIASACDWLDRNGRKGPFLLTVECFDPHEPFHVPPPYDMMYGEPVRNETYWPKYGKADRYEAAVVQRIRQFYAGKVTMLDAWLGRLLDRFDKYGLWGNTLLIFTADHGHYLGDHNLLGKPACNPWQTLFHIPLFVHFPGGLEGARSRAVSSAVDLFATMADGLGLKLKKPCHGRSLLPILRGEKKSVRDCAIMGYWGRSFALSDGRWKLHQAPAPGNKPLYRYGIETSTMRALRKLPQGVEIGKFVAHAGDNLVLRIPDSARESVEPLRTQLFDIQADPGETNDLSARDPKSLAAMQAKLVRALREMRVPDEHYERLGLA